MKIPCNTRVCRWSYSKGWGCFFPNGSLQLHGEASYLDNPRIWTGDPTVYSARIIVGLKRRGRPQVKLDEIVRHVRKVRTHQVGDPSSTFLTQRGLYKHEESGKVVDEPGVQVILLNVPPAKVRVPLFRTHVAELAESLARTFQQESVIVEIQRNGIVVQTYGMGP
jgi:hypothetical protein